MISWISSSIGGTHLRGYLYQSGKVNEFALLVAKLLTLTKQGMTALAGGDKTSVEFSGTHNGNVFTLYDYKGDFSLHIGGHDALDVQGLIKDLKALLKDVEPTEFRHKTDYDNVQVYGWSPEPSVEAMVERAALSDDDYSFIAQALRVAATSYERHGRMATVAAPELAARLDSQASRARTLADAIE